MFCLVPRAWAMVADGRPSSLYDGCHGGVNVQTKGPRAPLHCTDFACR
jgi:hypothetical protein